MLEKLDAETSARIKGCQSQIESLKFLSDLCLGQKLYRLTDNLSKTLQKKELPAISGQAISFLTIKTLEKMRSDRDFDLFYESISKKASRI